MFKATTLRYKDKCVWVDVLDVNRYTSYYVIEQAQTSVRVYQLPSTSQRGNSDMTPAFSSLLFYGDANILALSGILISQIYNAS